MSRVERRTATTERPRGHVVLVVAQVAVGARVGVLLDEPGGVVVGALDVFLKFRALDPPLASPPYLDGRQFAVADESVDLGVADR
jgi:hypothetical protein